MRFLFFPGGSYIGGTEIVTFDLMRALVQQGHDCYAIVSGWNDGAYIDLLRNVVKHQAVKLGRIYRSKPLWTFDTLLNLPGAALRLRDIINRFRPDAMVLGGIEQALTVMHVAPRRLPFLIHLHAEPDSRWGGTLGNHVLPRAKGVIAVSQFVADRIATLRPGTRVVVVHNATSISAPVSRSVASRLRIGCIGRVSEQKRQHVLVEAIRLLDASTRSLVDVRLYGQDQTAHAEELRRKINAYGLQDQFTWMGVRDRDDIYHDLDIVAALSVGEGFGLTLLEAATFGLPVVASRSGAHPEIVEHDQTGLLVDPDDAAAVARSIVALVDVALRRRLGAAAQVRAATKFNLSHMAANFVAAAAAIDVRAALPSAETAHIRPRLVAPFR